MRGLVIGAVVALSFSGAAFAQGSHYVEGYTRSNGTYVAPHYQTNPDSTRANNYSTEGNVNPYTGQPGTKPLYPNSGSSYTPSYTPAPNYGYQQPAQPQYGSSYKAPKACTAYGC